MAEDRPSKLKPRAIDDKDSRAAAAAAYAARMGTRRASEPDATPAWLRTLLDACEKPAKRNPTLAAALNGVPVKYRPATGPDPKDTHERDNDPDRRPRRTVRPRNQRDR